MNERQFEDDRTRVSVGKPPLPKDLKEQLKKLDLGRVNRNIRETMAA
jgi:hypothetical protein